MKSVVTFLFLLCTSLLQVVVRPQAPQHFRSSEMQATSRWMLCLLVPLLGHFDQHAEESVTSTRLWRRMSDVVKGISFFAFSSKLSESVKMMACVKSLSHPLQAIVSGRSWFAGAAFWAHIFYNPTLTQPPTQLHHSPFLSSPKQSLLSELSSFFTELPACLQNFIPNKI